jgi:hypothetical protein
MIAYIHIAALNMYENNKVSNPPEFRLPHVPGYYIIKSSINRLLFARKYVDDVGGTYMS